MALRWACLLFSVVGLIRTGHEDGCPPIFLGHSVSTNKDSCSEQLSVSRTNSSCPSPSSESCAHEDIESDSTERVLLPEEASAPSAETSPPVIKGKKPCLCKSEWRHCVYSALYIYFHWCLCLMSPGIPFVFFIIKEYPNVLFDCTACPPSKLCSSCILLLLLSSLFLLCA